jgi:cytochrome c-type biogenesis protein
MAHHLRSDMTTLKDRPEETAPPAKRTPIPGIGRTLGTFALVLFVVGGLALGLLLTATAGDTDRPDATVLTQQDVTERLVRVVETDEVKFEMLYTPGWYFEWSARSEPEVDQPSVGFFLFETVHIGVLPPELPEMVITSDGNVLTPTRVSSIDNSEHHRVSELTFSAETEDGFRLVRDGDELVAEVNGMLAGTFVWNLDDSFGADLLGEATSAGIVSGKLTIPALLAIFAGMLTALSPCLLLLATYYTAVLSGTTVGSAAAEKAGKRLVTTSLAFVLGFTLIYTAGGVFAGWVGDSVGRLDAVGDWSKPISMIAGAVVILLGLRMAAQTRVPLVCKMPGFNRPSKSGFGGSLAMGGTFAVGCLSCFSATVLSALLLYAGATGSAVTGGLIMLTFSAGTGLIFILAAYLVARAVPVVGIMEKARPYIGAVSALVMIALGLLMLTYNFHKFTGWIFTLWS